MVEWTNTDKEYYLGLAKHYLPDGYVIVPIEPTEEMIQSAFKISPLNREWIILGYKAMINEAQK